MAFLTHAAIFGLVNHNAEDPGTQRRAGFESIQAFDHRHAGVLHHFFGYFSVPHMPHGHTDQCAVVFGHQFVECLLIALSQPREQLLLIVRQ